MRTIDVTLAMSEGTKRPWKGKDMGSGLAVVKVPEEHRWCGDAAVIQIATGGIVVACQSLEAAAAAAIELAPLADWTQLMDEVPKIAWPIVRKWDGGQTYEMPPVSDLWDNR